MFDKFRARRLVKKFAKEYLNEFTKAKFVEKECNIIIYIGTKNYFEINLNNNTIDISEIIYW